MAKFNFFKLSKSKKIRYLFNSTSNDIYVYFTWFQVRFRRDKPKTLFHFCKKNKIGFLALEYSGHGKSYGKFENGTISSWTDDKKNNKKIINKKKLIIVEYGGWIGLNLFKYFKKILLDLLV